MTLDEQNDWVWRSRWTHWWFKHAGAEAEAMPASCMDPAFTGILADDDLSRCVAALKAAHVNAIFTEGLRRLMLFEHQGKTDAVNASIRKATQLCHDAGIRVVHHTTATFADQRLEDIQPPYRQWLSVDARTGSYAFIDWVGGWYLWCINNPAFRDEYFRLSKKVLAETGVDGLMVDEVYFRTGWTGCVCPHCREKFLQQGGIELPPVDDPSFWGNFENAAFRAWIQFRCRSVGDFYVDLRSAMHQIAPHAVLTGCENAVEDLASRRYGDSNTERMRGLNVSFTEISASGSALLYGWRRLSYNLTAFEGFSCHYGTPTVAIMNHTNVEEGFLNWALRVSHGMRVWALTGGGGLSPEQELVRSPADLAMYEELFGWEEAHEAELVGMIQPLASVGVVFSASTGEVAKHGGDWNYHVREFIGWCEALAEEHIQYAVLLDADLTAEGLEPFDTVVLPNSACLSDDACEAIVDYVAGGGAVIFTNEAGHCDETGAARDVQDRLTTVLGPLLTDCGTSVQFGTHRGGTWAYFSHKPGMATYTTTNQLGQRRLRDTEDVPPVGEDQRVLQRALMIDAVRWATGNQFPLTVGQAPNSVLVKAFTRYGKEPEAVVHLLNLQGEQAVTFGEVIPQRYTVEYPALIDDIVLTFRGEAPDEAYLFSPDWPGRRRVGVNGVDGGFSVTIPADSLVRYTVLYLA